MSPDQATSGRSRTGFKAVIALNAVTLVLLVSFWVQLRQSRAKLSGAQAGEQRLLSIQTKLAEHRSAIAWKQNRVIKLLRHSRTAEEIPALGGGRIASVMNHSRDLVMYVPDGEYELEVNYYRILPRAEEQKLAWTVPLSGAAGYLFQVKAISHDAPPTWSLSSNDPAFGERREQLSDQTFFGKSWSANMHEWFCFPNMMSDFGKGKFQAFINDPPPIPVFDVAYTQTAVGEEKLEFRVRALLHSRNPPCVRSRDYYKLVRLGQENRAMPYQGDGVHYLRTDANSE